MQGVVYSLLRLTTYIRRIRVELAQLCINLKVLEIQFLLKFRLKFHIIC